MPEKKFTQIAFTFEEPEGVEIAPQVEVTPDIPPASPVNVGFRIKAFKQALAPETETKPEVLPKVKSTRGRKAIKDSEAAASLIQIPEDTILFQKQYYSIGEVASMFKVNTSLIRYWANEFDMVQPRKNRKGDRHFRPVDIKNLLLIHDLLRRKKLTIEGAKDYLKNNKKAQEKFEMIESLKSMKRFLQAMKTAL
jgi:DNA-binding transcriptional MerR regulator